MAKHKYKFNPESLSYIKVTRTAKQKAGRFFTYFIASIVLAVLYAFVFSVFFDSPLEKGMKSEESPMPDTRVLSNLPSAEPLSRQ